MKIGHPADTPVTPAVPGNQAAKTEPAKAGSTAASPAPVAGAADASATVALSSTAATLLSSGPGEFDSGKVDRVSGAIASGTFRIDPEAIADKLISNAQELLSKAKS